MKTIKLLLLAFLLTAFNCSPDEIEECGCYKVVTNFNEIEEYRIKVNNQECSNLVPGQPHFYYIDVPMQTIFRYEDTCQ
jgi:hypothetical protein